MTTERGSKRIHTKTGSSTRIWYSIPTSRCVIAELKRRHLCIVIRLPKLKDLEQKILTFPNCDNYGIHRSSNPNLTSDDIKLNDNALHQKICTHFKVEYLEKMDIIIQQKMN